jgi:hypothetical protein
VHNRQGTHRDPIGNQKSASVPEALLANPLIPVEDSLVHREALETDQFIDWKPPTSDGHQSRDLVMEEERASVL